MKQELITIVTVCFNAEKTIKKTMESILEQTYEPLEYIIIDGKSTDQTLQIINELATSFIGKGVKFHLLSEPDKGIFDAMNKGIRLATGRWINFMNAGDVFCDKDTITRLFASDINPEAKLVYGDTLRQKPYGVVSSKGNAPETTPQLMPACHQSIFADTDEMKNHPFDLSFRLAADYHFVYNLYMRGGILQYIPVNVSLFDATEGATATNKLDVKRECARIRGIEHTMKWKLYFLNKMLSYAFKSLTDNLIPKHWQTIIKKKNRQRMANRKNNI